MKFIKDWLRGYSTFKKKCTCGEHDTCTIKYYITSRGSWGMKSGLGNCGGFIKTLNKFKNIQPYKNQ